MAGNPSPPGDNPLAQLIRITRLSQRKTLAQVADAAGVSESYVSRLETGKRHRLTREVAIRLAQALGLDPIEVQRMGGVLDGDSMARAAGLASFRRAVLEDSNLTADQKQLLIGMYMSWVPHSTNDAGFDD